MFVCLRLIRTRPACDVTREGEGETGTRAGRAGGLVRVASGGRRMNGHVFVLRIESIVNG